jgi:hypothetical protein
MGECREHENYSETAEQPCSHCRRANHREMDRIIGLDGVVFGAMIP